MTPPVKANRPRHGRALAQAEGGGAPGRVPRSAARARIAAVALLATFLCLVAVSTFFKLSGWAEHPRGPSAAIVDQLGLTFPDPGFVETASRTLREAGYAVDYYAPHEATVELYRGLPKRGYDLVILRTHAGRLADDQGALTDDAGLFTSDAYSGTRYVEEQRAARLGAATYSDFAEGPPAYFAIKPDFVRSSMKGRFRDTVVIIMGCDGLRSDRLAEAFVQRGALAVVSWDGPVSAAHTDAATQRLLEQLVVRRLGVVQAVAQTIAQVGPDPGSGSNLVFYPPKSAASRPEGAYLAP